MTVLFNRASDRHTSPVASPDRVVSHTVSLPRRVGLEEKIRLVPEPMVAAGSAAEVRPPIPRRSVCASGICECSRWASVSAELDACRAAQQALDRERQRRPPIRA
jgi:hypothetical protein